jgi:GAF domain-containing protein
MSSNSHDEPQSDERLPERLREALTKAATARTIAASAVRSSLLLGIVETAAHVISARAAALFLVDEETQDLRVVVALGERAEAMEPERLPVGHGIAGGVALSGQPMAVSDVQHDERWAVEIGERVGYTPETILCVPLFREDGLIGVLELLDKEGAPFDEADITTLSLFGRQVAAAIEQLHVQQGEDALVASILRSATSAGDGRDKTVEADIRELSASIENDDAFRRSLRLADLIREIGREGDRELEACEQILQSFAAYLRARGAAL